MIWNSEKGDGTVLGTGKDDLFPLRMGRRSYEDSDMSRYEEIFRACQRKMYEMKKFRNQHPESDTSDPLNIAMGYVQTNRPEMRMGRALRRVHDDPDNPANIDFVEPSDDKNNENDKLKKEGVDEGRAIYV